MEFYDTVAGSKKYSWMGLFKTKDELERPRLIVYLHEKVYPQAQAHTLAQATDTEIGQAFDELFLALPPQVILDLYFNCEESDNREELVESCMQDVASRYGTTEMPASVAHRWDQEFSLIGFLH